MTDIAIAGMAGSAAELVSAIERRDAIAAMDCYVPGAVLLPFADRPVLGRTGIEAFWWAGLESGLCAVELRPLVSHRCACLGVEIGEVAFRAESAGGQPMRTGRYATLLRRGPAGRWQRAVELFADSEDGDDRPTDASDSVHHPTAPGAT